MSNSGMDSPKADDKFSLLSDRDLIPLEEFNKSILEETSK
jgi:hypothetical protein